MSHEISHYADKVILTKGGSIIIKYWDSDMEEPEYKNIEITKIHNIYNITKNLNVNIELEEGFNMRDYFEIFNKYKILVLLVDPYINSYMTTYNSIKEENVKDCLCTDIAHISIYNICEFEKMNGEYFFNSSYGLSGISTNQDGPYSISFIPLRELLDIPLKITKPYFGYVNYDTSNRYNKNKEKELLDPINKINTDIQMANGISLYDFLTSIIYEISFYGDSSETEEKKNEFHKICEEVEGDIKSGKISEYESFDDLLNEPKPEKGE